MARLSKNEARSGSYTRREIKNVARPGLARDDIDHAYAGDKNKGPAANEKLSDKKDTSVKGRKIGKDSGRTPVV